MTLTMVSNYINHHQIPMSNELFKILGADYTFIQTEEMEADRVRMGWGSEVGDIPYLKLYGEDEKGCAALIMDSDIVIFGGVEDESYIKPRLAAGKTVIRYSERLYRGGQWKTISPRGRKKKHEDHTQYADAPVYLLCHGAYVASDFALVGAYPDKKYVWGYFPELKTYDIDSLIEQKKHFDSDGKRQVRILWSGRFIKFKQPQDAIKSVKYLKDKGVCFHLDMVGGGELEGQLRSMVQHLGLLDEVTFHGYKKPKEVRKFMERADIFLFTSNYDEGWGVVLNEAMNSGCAVAADNGIGAVPFLLKHGYNGLVYRNGNRRELKKQLLTLCRDDELRKRLGKNAYLTIEKEWNPIEAAKRLYNFCEGLMEGETRICKSGPLSRAPMIWPLGGYMYTRH